MSLRMRATATTRTTCPATKRPTNTYQVRRRSLADGRAALVESANRRPDLRFSGAQRRRRAHEQFDWLHGRIAEVGYGLVAEAHAQRDQARRRAADHGDLERARQALREASRACRIGPGREHRKLSWPEPAHHVRAPGCGLKRIHAASHCPTHPS